MENTNAKKRKRLSPILLIFIILAALTAGAGMRGAYNMDERARIAQR